MQITNHLQPEEVATGRQVGNGVGGTALFGNARNPRLAGAKMIFIVKSIVLLRALENRRKADRRRRRVLRGGFDMPCGSMIKELMKRPTILFITCDKFRRNRNSTTRRRK